MFKFKKKNIPFLILSICIGLILGFCIGTIIKRYHTHREISRLKAAYKVLNTVNTYFVPGKNATLTSGPVEERGLYKVELTLDSVTQAFYLTKDGEILILPEGMVHIAKLKNAVKQQQPVKNEGISKSDKPVVELFVMSLCPYGSRAEKEIAPLITSFGNKVDFKIKFIVSNEGKSLKDFSSLHGIDEVEEDARQAAILKYYPDKFSAYIDKINEKSCVLSCGAIKLKDYWKVVAANLNMDIKKIENFAYGREGVALLKENGADAQKYNAFASPTLVINGAKSEAIYKGKKAVEEAVCSAFIKAPDMCRKEQSGS
ncbi:MAG: hypothetical protein PHP17_07500 [Candidatus Omnitrophica bacterium]|nr:hypothetical protein [Candidatus Omnitrophota bacterium]